MWQFVRSNGPWNWSNRFHLPLNIGKCKNLMIPAQRTANWLLMLKFWRNWKSLVIFNLRVSWSHHVVSLTKFPLRYFGLMRSIMEYSSAPLLIGLSKTDAKKTSQFSFIFRPQTSFFKSGRTSCDAKSEIEWVGGALQCVILVALSLAFADELLWTAELGSTVVTAFQLSWSDLSLHRVPIFRFGGETLAHMLAEMNESGQDFLRGGTMFRWVHVCLWNWKWQPRLKELASLFDATFL